MKGGQTPGVSVLGRTDEPSVSQIAHFSSGGGGQPVSKLKRPDVPPPEATRLIAPSIKDGINVLGGEMLRERPRCAFPLRLFQF